MTSQHNSISTSLAVRLHHFIREYKWEIAPFFWYAGGAFWFPLWGWLLLGGAVGRSVGAFLAIALAVPLLYPAFFSPRAAARRERRRIARLLKHWQETAISLGLAGRNAAGEYLVPPATRFEYLGTALQIDFALPTGVMPSMFEAKTEYLAGAFGGSSASVIRDPYSASSVTLQVMPEDNPLYEASPFDDVSQFLRLRQADDLIPLGRYETGEPCEIDLKEKSILIAGSPGSGKSVCMQQIISAAALSENTELWCIDPKGGVEILTFWGAICERSEDVTDDVGDDGRPVPNSGLERTSYMLADLQAEMARRYACMKERKIRYLPPSAENPRVLLVIDELASLTLCDDRKLKTLLVGQIRDLVAKGRAAGIVIVLATQYPKVEVLDSSIRSLLTLRVGFRIGEKVASDVVLGDGQAAAGADASEIPNTAPGVGFIVGDGDKVARKIRTHYLSDDDLRVIAEHAESFRGVSLDGEEVEALEAPDDLPEEAFYVPDEWGTDDVELDPAVVLSGCPEHLGNRGAEALQASQACDACKEARFCALTEESSE